MTKDLSDMVAMPDVGVSFSPRKLSPNRGLKPTPTWKLVGLVGLGLAATLPAFAAEGIATDGSLGPAHSLSGPDITVSQDLGSTVGKNLFHSFSQFNIATGQTVTFTENLPNSLDNIIARVTGGTGSDIDGTLRATPGGHANFYLLNPAGVLFGPNAKLDVAGDFHVSTADQMRFRDGALFSASQPTTSSLSAEAPAAFGFLGTSTLNNGLLKLDHAHLSTASGQAADLVAGDISLIDDDASKGANPAVRATQGELRLVAFRGAGEVGLEPDDASKLLPLPTQAPSPDNAGAISLDHASLIATYNKDHRLALWGGDINLTSASAKAIGQAGLLSPSGLVVRAHALELRDNSNLSTQITQFLGYAQPGDVDVVSTGSLLMMNQSSIGSLGISVSIFFSGSSSDSGNVHVSAPKLIMDNESAIRTESYNFSLFSSPNGKSGTGDIAVEAGTLELRNHAAIDTSNHGRSNAGNIQIKADTIGLSSGSEITASTKGIGKAGEVDITARRLTLDGSGATDTDCPACISSRAETSARGNAGTIRVSVDERLAILRGGFISTATEGTGDAGNLTVKARQIDIDRQGAVDSQGKDLLTGIGSRALSPNSGRAGTVEVDAGEDGDLSIAGGTLTVTTRSAEDAGEIRVRTGGLRLTSGGNIDASTLGAGNAGNVVIAAKRVSLSDGATLRSDAAQDSTGNTGAVRIAATDNVSVLNGARISSTTSGQGNADSVEIHTHDLTVDGGTGTAISTDATETSTGNAGTVQIVATGDVSVLNGARISSTTSGQGDADSVKISAENLIVDARKFDFAAYPDTYSASIQSRAETSATGDAGEVDLTVRNHLQVLSGGRISTTASGQGSSAGRLFIKVPQVVIDSRGLLDEKGEPRFTGLSSYSGKNAETGEVGGGIFVEASRALTLSGGTIRVTTAGDSDGGMIGVETGQLTMTAKSKIDASTIGLGQAGQILVDAGKTSLSNGSAIRSNAGIDSSGERNPITGDAGEVWIKIVGDLSLTGGSEISSDTESSGRAGDVAVSGQTVWLDNGTISAKAGPESNGQTGRVEVAARESLRLTQGSSISIENTSKHAFNEATKMGRILVNAPEVTLNQSQITTQSNQPGAPAGSIRVRVTDQLCLTQDSIISTNAKSGNGGTLTLEGGRLIHLLNSRLTTNVMGDEKGDGGDITLWADSLILETGHIQANTNGGAKGGDIHLNVGGTLASGETLSLGGSDPVTWRPYAFGDNVIQAAAPNGVNGDINTTAPQLNLSGVLANLGGPLFDASAISQEYCIAGDGSTLTRAGRGGLLPKGDDLLVY